MSDYKNQSISVVVPTYGRDCEVVNCLKSLMQQKIAPLEILVVDQSPLHGDSKIDFFNRNADKVRWIKLDTPNLPAARNAGLKAAIGNIVLFIDDDVTVEECFVSAHLANYTDSNVVAVAGAVWSPEKRPRCEWPAQCNDPLLKFFSANWQYDKRREVCHAPGGNMSVRREPALQCGGFDDAYEGNGFREETDFFIRLGKTGKIVYDPDAGLIHHAVQTSGCWAAPRDEFIKQRYRNHCRFVIKNFSSRYWPRLFISSLLTIVIRGGGLRKYKLLPIRMIWFLSAWRNALRTAQRMANIK